MDYDPKFVGGLLGAPQQQYGGDWKRYGMGPEHRFFGNDMPAVPGAAPTATAATDPSLNGGGGTPLVNTSITPEQEALLQAAGYTSNGEAGPSGWGSGSSIGRQGNDVDPTAAQTGRGALDMMGALAQHGVTGPAGAFATMAGLANATGTRGPGLLGPAWSAVSDFFNGPSATAQSTDTADNFGGGNPAGGDPSGTRGGGEDSGGAGSDPGGENGGTYATGGAVTAQRLTGRNPAGPDDGHATLQIGEFVAPAHQVRAIRSGGEAGRQAAADLIKRILHA